VTAETFTAIASLYAEGAAFAYSPRLMNAGHLARIVIAAVDLEPERLAQLAALHSRVEVLP